MNKSRKNIEREVEEILQCFDDSEEIYENPYFFIKVNARIEGATEPAKSPLSDFLTGIVRRPVFWLIVILMNLATIFYVMDNLGSKAVVSQEMNTFGQVYNLEQPSNQVITLNVSDADKPK